MKILVTIKRVPDSDQTLNIDAAGKALEPTAQHIVNPFDAIALEAALQIRENVDPDCEILAVSIGPGECESELRTALAMGADRGLLVDSTSILDPTGVARVLREIVQRESPRLILMGKQGVDYDYSQTGPRLAAYLGWPQATFASRIQLDSDRLCIDRETDQGMETVHVSLPAVVTCDLRLNEPRYASLPNILRAKNKQLDRIPLDELPIEIAPQIELLSMSVVPTQRTCQFVKNPRALIEKLRNEAQVL